MIADVLTIEQLIVFAVILVLCIIGSYAKDTIDTFTGKSEKILLKVIIISSLLVSILVWSFSEMIIDSIGFKPLLALSLVAGIISYDVALRLVNLSAGDLLRLLIKRDLSVLDKPNKVKETNKEEKE